MNYLRTLLALSLLSASASATPVILYQTGWEAAPADPPWLPGNVSPQNGWLSFNSAAGHQVVVNGTPGANVNGQDVTTPFGSQMHRFTGSTQAGAVPRIAWVDVATEFDSRPAGFNLLTGSIDLFVPGVQSADASLYGLIGFDGADDNFGVLVQPDTRSIHLIVDGALTATVDNAFQLNTWQNLGISANYDTGEVFALLDGQRVAGLSGTSARIVGGGFTDLDLYVANASTDPINRSIFSDNYVIQVVPEPGTWALLGLSGTMLALRRWRRS